MKIIIRKSDCKPSQKSATESATSVKIPLLQEDSTGTQSATDTDDSKKLSEKTGFSCDDTQCYVH